MKKIILIGILGVAGYVGFGIYQILNNNTEPEVSYELRQMVQEWKNQMNKENINYSAGFNRIESISISDDYGVVAGQCNPIKRSITISLEQAKRGYFSTRATLWHELGHYVFKLEHDDDPNTIMYYKSLKETEYKISWDNMKEYYFIKCKDSEWISRL
jgi:hypothetical protein